MKKNVEKMIKKVEESKKYFEKQGGEEKKVTVHYVTVNFAFWTSDRVIKLSSGTSNLFDESRRQK